MPLEKGRIDQLVEEECQKVTAPFDGYSEYSDELNSTVNDVLDLERRVIVYGSKSISDSIEKECRRLGEKIQKKQEESKKGNETN